VNGSRCIESVFGREINQLKQLILDLECEKTDIKKQLQWLESRGKKRKRQVDIWLEELVRLIESVENMNNLNDIHEINKLIKEDKPLTLSTEFIGETLNINIKKVLKLIEDDQVVVIGIYGMGVGNNLVCPRSNQPCNQF
jgi:sentrin-specific protease 7